MLSTSEIKNPDCLFSCFQTVKESKLTHATLITSLVAVLTIGILASTGVFNFMGTTNAAYLSYGMYGGAALFSIAEIINIADSCSKKNDSNELEKQQYTQRLKQEEEQRIERVRSNKVADEQVSNFEIHTVCGNNCQHKCRLTFTDGVSVNVTLGKEDIIVLKNAIQCQKIAFWGTSFGNYSIDYHFQGQGSTLPADQILSNLKTA